MFMMFEHFELGFSSGCAYPVFGRQFYVVWVRIAVWTYVETLVVGTET